MINDWLHFVFFLELFQKFIAYIIDVLKEMKQQYLIAGIVSLIVIVPGIILHRDIIVVPALLFALMVLALDFFDYVA